MVATGVVEAGAGEERGGIDGGSGRGRGMGGQGGGGERGGVEGWRARGGEEEGRCADCQDGWRGLVRIGGGEQGVLRQRVGLYGVVQRRAEGEGLRVWGEFEESDFALCWGG